MPLYYDPRSTTPVNALYLFRMRRSASTTFSTGVINPISWDTLDYGDPTHAIISGGSFLVPEDGIYHFDLGINIGAHPGTGNVAIQYFDTGSSSYLLAAEGTAVADTAGYCSASVDVYFPAATSVRTGCHWVGTGGSFSTASPETYWSGYQVRAGSAV